MNYYERHLGDYARDAGHLSMLEHGAYSLLLDRYYTTEQGIPKDQAHRVCRARTSDERKAVDVVLSEFFVLREGLWINGRAEIEIAKMQAKVKAARENGKRGGRPKQTKQKPSGFSLGSASETQDKAHQTPDTRQIPSEAIASGATAPPPVPVEPDPPDPQDVAYAVGVPLLTTAGVKESNARSFLAMQCKSHGAAAVADALHRCAEAKPVQPIPWLTAALKPRTASRHSGFASKDYRQGVDADGSLV